MKPLIIPVFAVIATAVASMPNASAAVIADFSGGNGTATPDQYLGTSGAGWSGAWVQPAGLSGTVVNTSPLDGGGNYLQANLSSTSAGLFINRSWDSAAAPYTDPLTISWTFRFDSPLTNFTAAADTIGFLEGVGANSTFQINALGLGSGGAPTRTWAFYDGNQDGGAFNANNYVSTGMALVSGTVYEFSVTLDPSTRTYVGTVSNGTTTFVSDPLGFRTSAFSANGSVQFGMRQSTGTDNFQFSLDSIQIVPEPSALGLVLLGLAGFGLRRRRPVQI
jgi:hypothetical protein